MLKIQVIELEIALASAKAIRDLERVDEIFLLPSGVDGCSFASMPKEEAEGWRARWRVIIDGHHKILADLGIELIP